ncbi:MAG: hypothetical protein HOH58_14860 [Opitutaceae bacterium]|nr:hypothetical protein [Opitutaceae bacterium]
MKLLEHWLVLLVLGLICNGLGIFLHRQGSENLAIAMVILGIINVATSMWLHHKSTPTDK